MIRRTHPDESLNSVLGRLDLHTVLPFQGKRIMDAEGNELFAGTASETWKWLRKTKRLAASS